ncbi:Protein EFFECTOR OF TRANSCRIPTION 2 [Bienertia sinuspersici]
MQMKSKSEAERTEAKLLGTFDYAWNKIGNGARRQNEILNKFETISSQNNKTSKIMKLLQSFSFNEQKVGIPIKAEKLSSDSNKTSHDNYNEKFNLFDRVFKFSCSQPRLVVPTNLEAIIEDFNPKRICGVISSDRSTCSNSPVKGRKRCAKHKGMRLKQNVSMSSNLKPIVEKPLCNVDIAGICGVKLGDGKCCERQPVKGRKRCEQHKGMRVDAYVSKIDKWLNLEYTNTYYTSPITDIISMKN